MRSEPLDVVTTESRPALQGCHALPTRSLLLGTCLWRRLTQLRGEHVSLLEALFFWLITYFIHQPQPHDLSLLMRIGSTLRG